MEKIRKIKTEFLLITILLISIFTFLSIKPHITTQILHSEARATGQLWAEHIERRIPNLGIHTGEEKLAKLEQAFRLGAIGRLAQDILMTKAIYQIDFINPDCNCALSIGTPHLTNKAPDHRANDAIDDYKIAATMPSAQQTPLAYDRKTAIKVFLSHEKQQQQQIMTPYEGQNVYDPEIVDTVTYKHADEILLGASNAPNQPHVYGDVYHPVESQGQTAFIIRVLVNLDEVAILYDRTLNSIGAVLLAAFSFGIALPHLHKLKFQLRAKSLWHQANIFMVIALSLAAIIMSLSNPFQFHIDADKLKHFVAYFLIAFFALNQAKSKITTVCIITAIIAASGLIELVQPYFDRSSSLADFFANCAGVMVAILAVSLVKQSLMKKHGRPVSQS